MVMAILATNSRREILVVGWLVRDSCEFFDGVLLMT